MAATSKKRAAKTAAGKRAAAPSEKAAGATAKKTGAAVASKKLAAASKKPSAAASKKQTAAAGKKRAANKKQAADVKRSAAGEERRTAASKKQTASASKKQSAAADTKQSAAASAKLSAAAGKRSDAAGARRELDFSDFPPGTVTHNARHVCLACIFDLFTAQLGLAPRTAYTEIRRHAPTPQELAAQEPARPYFTSDESNPRCPYCDAGRRWHARLDLYRVEGSKATDAPRRALAKSLPQSDEQFHSAESRSTRRAVFFEWLDALGRRLDFASDGWLSEATRAFLERADPKTDWAAAFDGARAVRRSSRLAEGWERDGPRLFLAPRLYGSALLVQYLVSRSHAHGGVTLEGRLTLLELVRRLRHSGHLDAEGITERDQFDVLEKLIDTLSGGDEPVKLHYLLDRRDFLDKVKTVYARYA